MGDVYGFRGPPRNIVRLTRTSARRSPRARGKLGPSPSRSSMIDSAEAIEDTATCDVCGSSLLLRNRYALAEGWSLYVVCSESCLRVARRAQRRRLWGARWRGATRLAVVITLVAACVTPHEGPAHPRRAEASALAAVAADPAPPHLPTGWFGPEW